MPFIFRGTLRPNAERVLVRKKLADSTAFTVGDAVKVNTSNVLVLWGTGGPGLGILVGFQKADGSPVTDNGAGADFTNTYTTGSGNTVEGIFDVSTESMYSVPLDAARGTTSGSEDDYTNFDCVAASDVLDESSMAVAGATASFCVHSSDPDVSAPANSVLCTIQESMVKL